MPWRSRKGEREAAAAVSAQGGDMVRKGQGMIAQGEAMIKQGQGLQVRGRASDPGRVNWVGYMTNPFALSEYNSEEIVKGALYMMLSIVPVAIGGFVGHQLPELSCCSSVGMWAGGACFLCGIAHVSVGSR